MDDAVSKIKENVTVVLSKMGIEFDDDPFLELMCQSVHDEIIAYTHMRKVPRELLTVVSYRAIGKYMQSLRGSGRLSGVNYEAVSDATTGTIKTISEGDTSITYAVGNGETTQGEKVDAFIDKMIVYGDDILKSYRRVVW